MAAISQVRLASMATFLPRFSALAMFSSIRVTAHTIHMAVSFLPSITVPVLGILIRLPSLQDIWEGILKAVPKKKTSHMKKRHRQMAGKALEDVNSFCTCPGCGNTKRMHRMCPHCMKRINEVWRQDNPSGKFLD